MENKISPSHQLSILSPKSSLSPNKRHVLREISQNMNTSQISNGDSKVSNNVSPIPPNNSLPVVPDISPSKGSDESSDSSLDYGSANEDSTNRDDTLIHAFNDIHLSTPKTDGNNLREKILVSSLEGSVKFECSKSLSTSTDAQSTGNEENEVHLDVDPSRKQKVFNIITECFETPDSSLIVNQTLDLSKENLEIGQDPLNITSDVITFNVPTIDPVLQKATPPDNVIHPTVEHFHEKVVNATLDNCDADDGIAVISNHCSTSSTDVEAKQSQVKQEEQPHDELTTTCVTEKPSEFINELEFISVGAQILSDETNVDLSKSIHSVTTQDIDNEGIAVLLTTDGIKDSNNVNSNDFEDQIPTFETRILLDDDLHNFPLKDPLSISLSESVIKETAESIVSQIVEHVQTLDIPIVSNEHGNKVCLNETYSEPMDCDEVSFISTTIKDIQCLNGSAVQQNSSTIISNQTYNHEDTFEPMDCDEYIEQEVEQEIPIAFNQYVLPNDITLKNDAVSLNLTHVNNIETVVSDNANKSLSHLSAVENEDTQKINEQTDHPLSENKNNVDTIPVLDNLENVEPEIIQVQATPENVSSIVYIELEKPVEQEKKSSENIQNNIFLPVASSSVENVNSSEETNKIASEIDVHVSHNLLNTVNNESQNIEEKIEIVAETDILSTAVTEVRKIENIDLQNKTEDRIIPEINHKDVDLNATSTLENISIQESQKHVEENNQLLAANTVKNDIVSVIQSVKKNPANIDTVESQLSLEQENQELVGKNELLTENNTNLDVEPIISIQAKPLESNDAPKKNEVEIVTSNLDNIVVEKEFVDLPTKTPIKQEEINKCSVEIDFNPFVTRSKVTNSPDKTDDLKYNDIKYDEINPFATRSRIVNTPDRESSFKDDMNRSFQKNTPTKIISENTIQQNIEKSDSHIVSETDSPVKIREQSVVNLSNISDEECPPMIFNDAEIISEDISKVSPVKNAAVETNANVGDDIVMKIDKDNELQSNIDECLDEEFKRPLVLQSDMSNTDYDALESDSDTLSVCSSVNAMDINPFETKCKMANSPVRDVEDMDKTLTAERNDLNENTFNKTLVVKGNETSHNVDGNVIMTQSPMSVVSAKPHLSDTIVISDSPVGVQDNTFKHPSTATKNLTNKIGKSPDYNDNTPKTAKAIGLEKNGNKEHEFVSPLAHVKRPKDFAKRKIGEKKGSNLSPMSRCGDLMGLSPVLHTEDECFNANNQVSEEELKKDPFFYDDLEEEFKMPANFIKDDNLDFLLTCGSSQAQQYQCKESLLLRFDPLLSTGRGLLPTGVRPGRETIPESPRLEEDASTASGLAESCSSDSSPLTTSISEGKTLGKMSSMDQSFGAASPKVVNVTPQPVEKPTQVVTPAISTRQSITPLSAKNLPVTPAKSVTSAIAAIDRLISLGGTPPPPPVVQPKEPEMDPRMVAELQSVRELLAKQEEELRKVEEQKQSLESQLTDAVSREQTLIERLNDKTIDRRQMDTVLEEYERTMTQFIGEREVEKRKWEEERIALVRERDEANAHLANMEHSFNDIHAKYERCKQMIQGYKANEEILKETVRSNDEASKKQLERYEHLRQHAMSQLEIANQEIDTVKKSSQAEIIKLQAMLKKSEINVTSLQESLAQKTKDIEELTAICDELIQKVG